MRLELDESLVVPPSEASARLSTARERLYRSPAPAPKSPPKFRPYRPHRHATVIPITVSSWPTAIIIQRDDMIIVRCPTVGAIVDAACDHFGVSACDIVSQRRTKREVRARQVVFYLACLMTTKSLTEISRMIGGRDHSTCWHARSKIARLIQTDERVAADVAAIREKLEQRL